MTTESLQYHIACKSGDVGGYVLLPGSPNRCPKIAAHFDNPIEVANNREYRVITGSLLGVKVSVCSTGIGGPSTAIAVEELSAIGAHTLIRVGTSGIMQPHMKEGELVIATGAVRDEGTSHQYLPAAFPAIASPEVVAAYTAALQHMTTHIGVVHSKDSFYGEVESERMPLKRHLQERWAAWISGGCLCSEMESATLFIVSSYLAKRAGGLMLAGANHDYEPALCEAAIIGLKELIRRDGLA